MEVRRNPMRATRVVTPPRVPVLRTLSPEEREAIIELCSDRLKTPDGRVRQWRWEYLAARLKRSKEDSLHWQMRCAGIDMRAAAMRWGEKFKTFQKVCNEFMKELEQIKVDLDTARLEDDHELWDLYVFF